MFKAIIGVLFVFSTEFISVQSSIYNKVHYLDHGDKYSVNPSGSGLDLETFCYKGRKKSIIYTWQSVIFTIHHPSDDYTLYEGCSPEDVQMEFSKNKYYWSPNIFMVKQKSFKIDPFNDTCIGVRSIAPYVVHYNVINLDFWKLLFLGVGIGLFLSADALSKNTVFHYISGITFGICASTLIIIYFISKLFPRKPFVYGALGLGWTLVIYLGNIIWENIQTIVTEYKLYVLWYILLTGLVSFVFCYRWGPVKNQRTMNLIKWSLQFLGMCSIFNSSSYQEAAMAQIVILLISYNLPQRWKMAPKNYWIRRFPPKVKFLSNEEYYQQGVRETAKALDELRTYCSSPDCNQWKTALKLKDVKRFASFMEGNSHLSDDELLEYETFIHDLTDDEDNTLTDEDDED
ncbi:unnamed protein product [Phyllotreta striolata]|uniref:Nuclear envelope integral membrane protein 1 n=1 Tax=Phyllotreta striolata TaxID=444603 RepID=A0A9N9XM64_PHYSR|nr:unnamed protein product [Phyllotreta striolata]